MVVQEKGLKLREAALASFPPLADSHLDYFDANKKLLIKVPAVDALNGWLSKHLTSKRLSAAKIADSTEVKKLILGQVGKTSHKFDIALVGFDATASLFSRYLHPDGILEKLSSRLKLNGAVVFFVSPDHLDTYNSALIGYCLGWVDVKNRTGIRATYNSLIGNPQPPRWDAPQGVAPQYFYQHHRLISNGEAAVEYEIHIVSCREMPVDQERVSGGSQVCLEPSEIRAALKSREFNQQFATKKQRLARKVVTGLVKQLANFAEGKVPSVESLSELARRHKIKKKSVAYFVKRYLPKTLWRELSRTRTMRARGTRDNIISRVKADIAKHQSGKLTELPLDNHYRRDFSAAAGHRVADCFAMGLTEDERNYRNAQLERQRAAASERLLQFVKAEIQLYERTGAEVSTLLDLAKRFHMNNKTVGKILKAGLTAAELEGRRKANGRRSGGERAERQFTQFVREELVNFQRFGQKMSTLDQLARRFHIVQAEVRRVLKNNFSKTELAEMLRSRQDGSATAGTATSSTNKPVVAPKLGSSSPRLQQASSGAS